MSDEQARALGERWEKAGGGWRPGMLDEQGRRVDYLDGYGNPFRATTTPDGLGGLTRSGCRLDSRWPDLRDPATRGAALEVVRERLREPTLHVQHVRGRGWEAIGFAAPVAFFPSEAEALVGALEATPKS